jgi:mannitol/fructose-specific phosphotransferase system IIA component (Ntr-type)
LAGSILARFWSGSIFDRGVGIVGESLGERGMLRDAVDSRSIVVKAEADSWQAAVELSGELLVAAEGVEERYGPAMIQPVEELGTYVVIAPEVAIPHARPEDGR